MTDVLVLDWMLPGTTGGDLLRQLRQDARTREMRVVILSSLPTDGGRDIDVAFAYGVLAWLEKWKTTPAVLAQRIREALPTGAAQPSQQPAGWRRPFAAPNGFDLKCLARPVVDSVCAKLISDPITLEEIDGGAAQIAGSFTQATATQLAEALNSRSG